MTPRFLMRHHRLVHFSALAIAWVLLAALAWDLPLNNDLSWQYWIARQMLGGARLYIDIDESNPPLWFWGAIPLTWLADAVKIAPTHLAVAAVMGRIVLAAGLIGALSERHSGPRRVAAVVILIALGAFTFGERDHLMAIGALPYGLLIARRADDRPVAIPLAVAVALLAGWGFAMKPHFVLVPILAEGWLLLRRGRHVIRPETITLVALAFGYTVTILIGVPAYLTRELPLVLSAYGDFKPSFVRLWTRQIYAPVWLLGVGAIVTARRRNSAGEAATVAAFASLSIYALQGKGFAYHAVPVTITTAWAAWLLLETERGQLSRLLALLTLATALGTAALVGPFRPSRLDGIGIALDRLPAGATFALISAHSWDAFPLVERQRLVWPLRGLLLWTLPTIARGGADTPLASQVRSEVVADLWCHPPDAILFDDPARSPAMPHTGPGARFDYRRFVLADPAARDLMASYRLEARAGAATLWQRVRPLMPRGQGCRTVTIRPLARNG